MHHDIGDGGWHQAIPSSARAWMRMAFWRLLALGRATAWPSAQHASLSRVPNMNKLLVLESCASGLTLADPEPVAASSVKPNRRGTLQKMSSNEHQQHQRHLNNPLDGSQLRPPNVEKQVLS